MQGSCHETSYRDLVGRPGEENMDLAQGSLVESLDGDLTLRSWTHFTENLTKESCTAASTQNLSRRSCT